LTQIKSITVKNATYNVAQASAVQQKKLMLLIGAKIAFNSAAGDIEKINVPMLVGALMSLPEHVFDEVSGIVLGKAFLAGSTTPITIDAFQGEMIAYMNLVAEAIAYNLDDFFTWLDSENAARRAQTKAN
jgi:hypothetical protein